mgnify:FL=1
MANKVPLRLGPLAVLLLVVSVALTTLSILSYSTAHADLILAQRFAQSVESRYALEREGNRFLYDLKQQNADDYTVEDDIVRKEWELNGYTLRIEVRNLREVEKWQIRKEWEYDDTISDLWNGE